MPLRLLVFTVVTLLPLRAASAATVSEDVPLPGGTAALAHVLGIDPVPERGRFMYELTRLLYNTPEGRKSSADAWLVAMRQPVVHGRRSDRPQDTRAAELVPVPLSVDFWSGTIFHRPVAPNELVGAILADRSAALLCLGLTMLDDGTLEYFASHDSVLERIYERSAAVFGAFASSLRIQNNRLVPAGGDAAVALWEAVVGEKVTRVDRFLTQLFELSEGRLAYLYDVIAQIDAPRRNFALGLYLPNAARRVDRFKLLVLGVGAFREAHMKTLPFGRASYDVTMAFMRLQVADDGTPKPPAARGFWSRVFAAGGGLPDDAARQLRNAEEDPIDAAWLIEAIGSADVRLRSERLDQIAFAQRVFGAVQGDALADAYIATRALSHYRMLIWTVERIGVTTPAVFAAAARQAARIGALEGRRGFEALAQFQGALALVARIANVRTLDTARAQKLVERLIALPLNGDGRYAGAVARWLKDEVVPVAKPAASHEAAVIAAMSGGPSGEGPVARAVTWEGQAYRLDLGAAERRRLQRVREKQEGVALDVPLELAEAARTLGGGSVSADMLQAIVKRLTALADDIPRRIGHENEPSPPGITPPPNAADAMRKAIAELPRDVRTREMKPSTRVTMLTELADTLLAQALLSIAYAADVGDPEGTVLLADDVSRRHDFGLGSRDNDMRQRLAWMIPKVEVTPGTPWHVSGSLLGLDIALAPLALRRLNFERVLEAPKLTSNERDAFALSVSLLNPFDMRDADRDAIAAVIDRGRRRLVTLGSAGAAAVDRVADEASIEPWRRRALRWMLAHEIDRVPLMFSLTETLVLGGGRPADFDRWGMAMMAADGCVCSRLTPPGHWPTLLGRPPLGLTASAVADLNLHVAIMLKDLRLPAAVAKVVLSGAMQDFVDEARPTDDADWLTLSRTARTMTRERIEDYIAAATAAGPLVPEPGSPAGVPREQ